MDRGYQNKNIKPNFEKNAGFPTNFETGELAEKDISKKIENNTEQPKADLKQTVPTNLKSETQSTNENLPTDQVMVENILAQGLDVLYNNLDQNQKLIFKAKGEQTAHSIILILQNVKFKIYEIVDLIRNWLFIIPGLNKFFLEQEAKIKTDKILKINLKNKKQ